MVEAPQHMLRAIAAPTKVRCVPTGESFFPVGEEFRIIGRTPSPGNRVAKKIHIDAALTQLGQELLMRQTRGGVGTLDRLIRQDRLVWIRGTTVYSGKQDDEER